MKKRCFATCFFRTIIILATILLAANIVSAASMGDSVNQEILERLSLDNVNNFVAKVNKELSTEIPALNKETILKIAEQGINISWQDIWKNVFAVFFHELLANMHLAGKLLFLAVLCVLLHNLQNSFAQSEISLLAYSVCFAFLSVIALTAYYNAVSIVQNAVDYMVGFMEALLPLLLTLLAGVGALSSVAMLTPLMLFVIGTISIIVKNVVIPLLFMTAVLDCVNVLSDRYRLNNLASLLKQTSMVILGLVLVTFVGFITVQGVAGSIADGIGLRTAKFATAVFVPVVGKMFADTVEVVMGASLLLKNAIGIFGVLVVSLICLFPAVKLLCLVFVIKIAGALVQPMGDEKMAHCLDTIGNNLLLIFGALATVALMFFLVITMIVGAGSMSMMLR